MHPKIEQRLTRLGITLPSPAPPAGSCDPFILYGSTLMISGQLPFEGGSIAYRGRVGSDITVDEGKAAARLCGLNLLAQARAACEGDLDRVRRLCRLGGFVQAGPSFTEHAAVLDGASALMLEIFGQDGRHVRFAVGAASLPLDAAVEIDALFEIA